MALICRDIQPPRFDPQVLHTPLNTGADGYAHTMHSFMNNAPFGDVPATFNVVPARGARVLSGGRVGALTYALDCGYRMYVRVRMSGEEEVRGGRR
ncbi:hypothetical protein MSAS_34390 [Mycobacterium saskatchewanense]|nr:hypothetical protein MSAS_34390 [Mycobacterium saskatchewanense]